MRRVLMTAETGGGVWTYTRDLAAALRRRGDDVVIATMGAPLEREERAAAESRGIRLHESEFPAEWLPGVWAEIDRAGDWLLEVAEREAPDLVHLNGYCHANRAWRRPVIVTAHHCVFSWWTAVHRQAPPASWDEYRARVTAGLEAARRVIAPTRALLRALEEHYTALPHARVVVSGRDARAVRPGVKQSFVLSAGRLWDEAKNLAALDRAAAELPWPVRVAGDAFHPDAGRAVEPLHLEVLGRLSRPVLAEVMSRAPIYAAPARYEPFGMAAVEAGLAGCALVLGDLPSLREVWGGAALFVDPDDPDRLAATLRELTGNGRRRGQLARAARLRALSLGPDRMADEVSSIYDEVMSESRGDGARAAMLAGG
ncbi:MAG TPA: glycosyltransferase family 4 protein [Kofleriaceae bacterium]|nr:glycosyltransferase family 4 protein [Kofleriaceae bacterium]